MRRKIFCFFFFYVQFKFHNSNKCLYKKLSREIIRVVVVVCVDGCRISWLCSCCCFFKWVRGFVIVQKCFWFMKIKRKHLKKLTELIKEYK